MNSPTISSTQQQDQVARSNSAQMRRHGADQKAQQGPSAFADLLQQATEPVEVDSADLLADDTAADDALPTDPNEWLALTQAYGGTRAPDTPATDATTSRATQAVADASEAPADPLAQAASADGEPVPELDAEARAEATGASPRRAPARAAAGAAAASTTGLGAPTAGPQAGDTSRDSPVASAAGTVIAGAAALPLARPDMPARTASGSLPLPESTSGETTTPVPAGPERTSASRTDAGAPQTDVQTGGDGPSTSERSHQAEAPQPDATPWAEAMEDVGHQISYWLGKGVKQANIQVEAGLDRPLEVAVSLDKGQAVLHFQTDSAATRAAIESGAADALRDALARDGIGLAGLSVGSQDRQGQPGAESQPARRAWNVASTESATAEATALTPRSSNRVLDLYA